MNIKDFLNYLCSYREFTKQRSIDYINEIYNTDISEVINEYKLLDWLEIDIYDNYRNLNPLPDNYSNDRDYFSNKGRTYYINFIHNIGHLFDKDYLCHLYNSSEVHHIYPLVYGGGNELENLIHINNFHHNLLHENPLENDKRFCFQAIDYLYYINCPWNQDKNKILNDKYSMEKVKDKSPQYQFNFYKNMISQEMNDFYENIRDIGQVAN